MTTPIRVIIADDHAIVREGLAQLFSMAPEFEVVGEAASGDEVRGLLAQTPCDVLLLDMNMPGLTGVPLIIALRERYPTVPILVVSMHNDKEIVQGAIRRAGAAGFVTKDSSKQTLFDATRSIARGMKYIDPRVVEVLLDDSPGNDNDTDALSGREHQVLQMLRDGRTVGEIADQLNLSSKTVSTHKRRLMDKLRLTSNAELLTKPLRGTLSSMQYPLPLDADP